MTMKVLIYHREHNFTRWYIYWIAKSRTLGVTNGVDKFYTRTCAMDERLSLLNTSKTLIEDKWREVFSESGLKVENYNDEEMVLSFVLQQITLTRAEMQDANSAFFASFYDDRKALEEKTEEVVKRKRTMSESGAKPKKLTPIKKRVTKTAARPTGPEFVDSD